MRKNNAFTYVEVIAVAIVVAIIAGLVWFFFVKDDGSTQTTGPTANNKIVQPPKEAQEIIAATDKAPYIVVETVLKDAKQSKITNKRIVDNKNKTYAIFASGKLFNLVKGKNQWDRGPKNCFIKNKAMPGMGSMSTAGQYIPTGNYEYKVEDKDGGKTVTWSMPAPPNAPKNYVSPSAVITADNNTKRIKSVKISTGSPTAQVVNFTYPDSSQMPAEPTNICNKK